MSTRKIMILDDDEQYLEAMSALLEASGYTVRSCSKAVEGLAALREFKPHCLVLDLYMPALNGNELLPWIRCQEPNMPVVVCTGMEFDAFHLSSYGVRWILRKPFTEKAFFDTIQQAVEQFRSAA